MAAKIELDVCTPEGKTWLARLTGLGGRFGVEREFQAGRREVSHSGKTGTAFFTVTDGIYEAHEGRRRLGRSWYRVTGDTVERITEAQALAALSNPAKGSDSNG
jgi:serine phosphatase RsbU (regulator of sigma subunit)